MENNDKVNRLKECLELFVNATYTGCSKAELNELRIKAEATLKELDLIYSDNQDDIKYLYLKFGGIKGGDFSDSPEALRLYDQLSHDESSVEYKKVACEVIDSFNGTIYNWWDSKDATKEEAKDYILKYKHYQATL